MVIDTGIGIPARHHDRIFEAFTQEDESTTRQYGGTGLGLSICQKLVSLMGGSIWVTSEAGKGSTFGFNIELEKVSSQELSKEFNQVYDHALDALNILLVEDDILIRELIKELLKDKPFTIHTAVNGRIGVESVQSSYFDLVLMDMKMPEIDGYTATKMIREWEKKNSRDPIPIIALTANVTTDEIAQCLSVGCTSHLSKPIRKPLLLDTITRYGSKSV